MCYTRRMKKLIVYASEDCPIKAACQMLEGKWKVPMIYVLCENGTLRYNELRKALGITNMMLSNTLKQMEEDGLVNRVQYNEIPPRVEYSLTELAVQLIPMIDMMSRWGSLVMAEEHKNPAPDPDPEHKKSQ